MDSTFVQYINGKIKKKFSEYNHSVIFGQNIVSGSRISGLGAGLDQIDNCLALNTINSENSLVGLGFGLSLCEIPSMFLMKQHDFALLGLDQLVNTYNVLRNGRMRAPFVILMPIVDSGFEGPQSSLSSLDEFASLTRAPVLLLSSRESIDKAFKESSKPGLYLMALSQKNMKKICSPSEVENIDFDEAIIQKHIAHKETGVIAVVSFGVDLSIAIEVTERLNNERYSVNLVNLTKLSRVNLNSRLFMELANYDEFIILDSGKSEIHFSSDLVLKLREMGKYVDLYQRTPSQKWSEVNVDQNEFTADDIVGRIMKGRDIV